MPYTKLLNDLIEKSGLSIKEIAERCSENKQDVTAAYISQLRNAENKRIPSDEMSRALAIACNAKYENVLVIESYFDKAPIEMQSIINGLISKSFNYDLSHGDFRLSQDSIDKIIEDYKKKPISEFIISSSESLKTNDNKTDEIFIIPTTYTIINDSMFPILSQNCKVTLDQLDLYEYNNGDILAFMSIYEVETDYEIVYRKCLFLNDERSKVIMYPANSNYSPDFYDTDEITILGRVKQCIIDFD